MSTEMSKATISGPIDDGGTTPVERMLYREMIRRIVMRTIATEMSNHGFRYPETRIR